MNAQHTGLTGLGVQLDTTISQAKAAMEAIVAGVSQELTGFKRLVHHDHGKLNVMVGQLQQKFAEVDVTMQSLAAEMMAAVTRMDVRAALAEQRAALAEEGIEELRALTKAGPAILAGAFKPGSRTCRPGESPASSPPASPRGGPARFMQHAGADPLPGAAAAAGWWQPPPGAGAAARLPQSIASGAGLPPPWAGHEAMSEPLRGLEDGGR